jgi:Ca2+-binding EF-hand superfamily protein
MKTTCIIALTLGLFGGAAPTTTFAAKADGPKAKFFAKYDKNHNGLIDENEKEAIRKDFAADPNGDLKRFDKNGDGKLEDAEIAAIKPPTGKGKSGSTAVTDTLAKYDKNNNGVIDGDEKDALRKDFAASRDGALKKFDKNKDGKLDDEEIAALKVTSEKKSGGKGGKGGKFGGKAKADTAVKPDAEAK